MYVNTWRKKSSLAAGGEPPKKRALIVGQKSTLPGPHFLPILEIDRSRCDLCGHGWIVGRGRAGAFGRHTTTFPPLFANFRFGVRKLARRKTTRTIRPVVCIDSSSQIVRLLVQEALSASGNHSIHTAQRVVACGDAHFVNSTTPAVSTSELWSGTRLRTRWKVTLKRLFTVRANTST